MQLHNYGKQNLLYGLQNRALGNRNQYDFATSYNIPQVNMDE